VRIGATVHPTAFERVTPVTAPAATVATAVGRVVQFHTAHCVTVTRGTAVYPEPPPFVGITATVPASFEIAVAVVPPPVVLNVTVLTSLVVTSIVAVATGGVVHVSHVVVTVTVGFAV